MINAMGIALSGLNSASQRVNAAAANIANAYTVGSVEEGGRPAYTPRDVVQIAQENGGVLAQTVARDPASVPAYEPNSPFANEQGLVATPNVDLATEIVSMKLAEIAYKASIATLKTSEDMAEELLSAFDEKV